MSNYTEIDLAYFAGVIDCDGTINIYRSKKERPSKTRVNSDYVLPVSVVSVRHELPQWLKDTFGGYVHHRKSKNPRWRDKYEWSLVKKSLDKVLPLLKPYMELKGRQLDLALAFRETFTPLPPGQPRPDSVWEFRESCYQQMKDLNHVGNRHHLKQT